MKCAMFQAKFLIIITKQQRYIQYERYGTVHLYRSTQMMCFIWLRLQLIYLNFSLFCGKN